MDVEFGNVGCLNTEGTGWFIGFSDWTKHAPANLRQVSQEAIAKSLCVKWFHHQIGIPNGDPKPVSEGRTISILVSETGRFRLEFSTKDNFPAGSTDSYTLRAHGDFVIWGEGIYHRAYSEAESTILTLRWQGE